MLAPTTETTRRDIVGDVIEGAFWAALVTLCTLMVAAIAIMRVH